MDYYVGKLNANKMRQVYDTNIPRIAQYLKAEVDYIILFLDKSKSVLELGAGYGRILKEIAPYAKCAEGFDVSENSVAYGQQYLSDAQNITLYQGDVHTFHTQRRYDLVLCVQNGLSAMKGSASDIVKKAVSFAAPGGKAIFSSYSPNFWAYRLAWFQEQADKGLLGELDFDRSIHGQIVCKDGFTATTHTKKDFTAFASMFPYPYTVEEVDKSSIFLVIEKE